MKTPAIQKIIVLFDFSKCAENALEFALNLAKYTGSEIHVLHTYEFISRYIHDKEKNKALVAIKEETRAKMETAVQMLLNGREIKVHPYTKLGTLTGETRKLAERIGADLIIMGTYSRNPVRRFVMGSSTIDILENLKTPVLAVPPHCRYNGIQNVYFTTNFHSGSIPAIHKLQEMLHSFKADLSLLHFDDNGRAAHRKEVFMQLIKNDPKLRNVKLQAIKADSLLHGVWNYTRENPVDLMVMANKRRTGLSILFTTSTQDEAIYTQVPLLIIPRSAVMIDIALEDYEVL